MKLTFLGDIFPSDEPFSAGFGIRSLFEKGNCESWESHLRELTEGADIAIGNLESPLLPSEQAQRPDFYGSPDFAAFLSRCGLTALNVANNHILEHGTCGFSSTVSILEQVGLRVVGHHYQVSYFQKGSCRIAIAGFCGVDIDRFENKDCISELSLLHIKTALVEMDEQKADLKILYLHWGNEYTHLPSPEQRELAYEAINCGADIVMGHHPHVIQPYEPYRHGHIFYSLGNCCFDNPFQSRQFSKGMGVTIDFNEETKHIEHICFFGIKLRQHDLLKKMPTTTFQRYFDRIGRRYKRLSSRPDYAALYARQLRRRHFAERLLMKLSLPVLWWHLTAEERTCLRRNLKNIYLKKSNV